MRGSEITRWADTDAELPAGLKTASLSKPPRRQFSPSRLRFTAGVFPQNRGESGHRVDQSGDGAWDARPRPFRTEALYFAKIGRVGLPFPARLSPGSDVNSPMMSCNQSIFRTATSVCP